MIRHTIHYGKSASQFGHLYLPETSSRGIVCLLHGGFWKSAYGLDQFDGVAAALAGLNYCVWNIEYRRTGEPAYFWENPFTDVKNAINKLADIVKIHDSLNRIPVFVVGHSAGGHLALWLNSQELKADIQKFIALSPILDLETAFYENSGNGSVENLLQGSPNDFPERYQVTSPIRLSRKMKREEIIHGKLDEYIPADWSRRYHQHYPIHSDLIEIENCGHMEFIDPDSPAFEVLTSRLVLNRQEP